MGNVKERQIHIMEHGLGARGPIEMDWDMLKTYEAKIEADKNDYKLWNARGILYFNEDFEKAIESFSIALSLNPFGADQYYNRGRKFLSQDRFPQALADFTIATRLDVNDNWKWHFRGVALFFLERYKEAAESFYTGINVALDMGHEMIPPEVDWIWMSYIRMGDYGNAEKCLELVTQDTPVERGDLMYKKRCLLFKGETSFDDFMRDIEYDIPKRAITELYGAAQYCYYLKKDPQTAVMCLDKLLAYPTEHHAFGYKQALLDYGKWKREALANT